MKSDALDGDRLGPRGRSAASGSAAGAASLRVSLIPAD
jgi:hypothetical protein